MKTIAESSEKTLICVLDDCKTVEFQGLSIIENSVLIRFNSKDFFYCC